MDATDTPEVEAHDYVDTPDDGSGASADEGSEESEATEDFSDNPLALIDSLEGVSDETRDELKRGYLRQSDYTKKTQGLADERRSLDDRRSVVDQILLNQQGSKEDKGQDEVAETAPPDMANGDSPEDVISYYVDKAVQEKLKALGVGSAVEEIRPIAAQQRVVRAYQTWAKDYPDINHGEFASAVGHVLDTDPDLTDLASSDPERAIRIAAKVAQANMGQARTKAKSKKRREAAPVASRKGTVVTKRKRETALEAATRALKEQGINV